MKTISDKIFELLKEKGMSQKEFAQRTGIAESSISDWRDNNTYVISKDTEIGMLVETYQKLNTDAQKRVMGYLEALRELT